MKNAICAKSTNAVPEIEGGLRKLHFLQPILATLQPKIPIRYFWTWSDQKGQIQKFWTGESILVWNFTPLIVKFLSRVFYLFWLPYGQKFRFSTFNRGAARWVKFKNLACREYFASELYTSGA